ncbi:MAG: histidine phosphatase family protein [Planctomycetota bacterium]|nr:MAG: histidine phosphatase family protein [Planctomycetota bacterium]
MADLLVVVRAGTTDFDLQGRIRGNLDIPLSPGGAVAALTAAHELSAAPPLALYTSTAACAMETATIVAAALRLPPRRVPNLPNIDQGLWQGMLVEEIRRRQPRLAWHWEADPWKVAPPDGELVGEACDRVSGAIEKLLVRHPIGRVALVVPQPLDRIVRWVVAGEPVGDLWAVDGYGPDVRTLSVAGWSPRSAPVGVAAGSLGVIPIRPPAALRGENLGHNGLIHR